MKKEIRRKILARSAWFIVPYLFVFCLVSLGNVANNWNLPGIIVFIAQSLVIAIELFTGFHVALLIQQENVTDDSAIGFLMVVALLGVIAIPLSFAWGWVSFVLAFIPLLYYIGVSIYLFMSKQAVEQVPEEKLQEITQQAEQGE